MESSQKSKPQKTAIDLIIDDGRLREVCDRMDNGDDIYQEVILAILEMPETKINQIVNGGYLQFYCITMANRIGGAQNKLSKYYNAKRECPTNKFPDKIESCDLSEQVSAQIELSKIEDKLNAMSWYDSQLFRLYLELGSYRNVEAETGIPYKSVHETVKKVRLRIKNL